MSLCILTVGLIFRELDLPCQQVVQFNQFLVCLIALDFSKSLWYSQYYCYQPQFDTLVITLYMCSILRITVHT